MQDSPKKKKHKHLRALLSSNITACLSKKCPKEKQNLESLPVNLVAMKKISDDRNFYVY